MASLKEYRQEQLVKLQRMKDMGINPYPAKSFRDTAVAAIVGQPDQYIGNGACVAGRLMSIREHGQVMFLDIRDEGAEIQLIVRAESLEAEHPKGLLGFSDLGLLTRGDIIEAAGVVAHSDSGELSVETKGLRILSKVLRPLPDKLEDKETRMRRRYLDMTINDDVRARFMRRSAFWDATRSYLNQNGFSEINTPVLEHTTGGADANPFVTHMDALGEDFYLRISHELPLKRLLGGGMNKVYDLGPRFRNENYSDEHLPEHIAMEWYWAYADWQDGMKFMEDMYRHVLQQTFGTLQFDFRGQQIDMAGQWEQWDYAEVIKKHYDIDVFDCTIEQVAAALKANGLEVEKQDSLPRGIDKLWKNIRKDVVGPVWLINTPAFISPLSKASDDNSNYVQRFQPVIAGSELGNGWSELNDPVDQLDRFMAQQAMRDKGDEEAQMLDMDYVEMLEYGMPPACGWGNSERVFWIFEGVTAREGVVFPQLRAEVEESTKDIYPEIYGPSGLLAASGQRQQDDSKRIVAVVNKALEPWQVANTAAHMSAYHAHQMAKGEFDSGEFFVTRDSHQLPRNSQHPILIKKAELKDLRKLYKKAKDSNVKMHVFVREMIETNVDSEIVEALAGQSMDEVDIYGIALFGDNESVNALTKQYRLWS